ncbi:MAG TPA: IS481 family transposase [Kofleriaceae bacterium]|jgi:transposase InsO family protein
MEQRKEFIAAVLAKQHSFAEVCRRYGISRKNGYKWLNRHLASAAGGAAMRFDDHSRRPHRSPNAIGVAVEEAIVALRKQRPHWGPKKLRVLLAKAQPTMTLPSESTIAAVLKRCGLVKPRRRRPKTPPYSAPLAHAVGPNSLWTIDFKGEFLVGRSRCYPLTVVDSFSRYVLAIVGLTSTRTGPTRRALERLFDEYGLPEAIRSDNGSPFASRGVAGFSRLSVWWHRLGIRHERIEPGHPEQNGRHERMHADLKRETAMPPATTRKAQQRRFDEFRHRFNDERPHEALAGKTPSQLYALSARSAPVPIWGRDFEYEADVDTARVSKLGYIRTDRGAVFLSSALALEVVEIEWHERTRARIYFRDQLLGELRAAPNRRVVRFVALASAAAVTPRNTHRERP